MALAEAINDFTSCERRNMITAFTAKLIPTETLTQGAEIFEYSNAADPISSGATPRTLIPQTF
jgi:hypothetical protein